MTYSLAAVSFNKSELDKIQSPAMMSYLPAMGYDRHFPRSVVYAPTSMGGLGIKHLYTEENLLKIRVLIGHIRCHTYLGSLLRINLNWLQLNSGWTTPVLESKQSLEYVNERWFTRLQKFLVAIRGSIKVQGLWLPVKAREHDTSLIESFIGALHLSPAQLRQINAWRLYFRVTMLSDIVTASGTHIKPEYLKFSHAKHRNATDTRISRLRWPHQTCPGPNGFRLWKKCLQTVFNLDPVGRLGQPLGHWLLHHSDLQSEWPTYLDPHSGTLFKRATTENQFLMFRPSLYRASTIRYGTGHSVGPLTDSCIPIDATDIGTGWTAINRGLICLAHDRSPPNHPDQFDDWIDRLPDWKQNLLRNWSTISRAELRNFLRTASNPLIVSDGGLRHQKGTYGVVIGAHDGTYVAQSMGRLRGRDDLQSSFRSEAFGMLAGLCLWSELLQFFMLPSNSSRHLSLFSDNNGLVQRINSKHDGKLSPLLYLRSDSDAELQIKTCLQEIRQSGTTVSIQFVKGHQDRRFGPLTLPEYYNVYADSLATRAQLCPARSVLDALLPAAEAHLFIDSSEISSQLCSSVRIPALAEDYIKYLQQKYKWSRATIDTIWWIPFGTALKSLSWKDRIRVHKFCYGRLPTRHIEARAKPCMSAFCHRCRSKIEDNDHIVLCPDSDVTQIRTKWLQQISFFLESYPASTGLKAVILSGIRSWIHQAPPPALHSFPGISNDIRLALHEQNELGWNNFVRGRLSQRWADVISPALQQSDGRSISAEKWGTLMIRNLWFGIIQLWELRIESIYGKEGSKADEVRKMSLLLEAKGLQQQVSHRTLQDSQIIQKPPADLEQMSTRNLETWLRDCRMLIRLRDQDITPREGSAAIMRSWLNNTPHPCNNNTRTTNRLPVSRFTTDDTTNQQMSTRTEVANLYDHQSADDPNNSDQNIA